MKVLHKPISAEAYARVIVGCIGVGLGAGVVHLLYGNVLGVIPLAYALGLGLAHYKKHL